MATRAYDLHVDLVRQFMATVEFTYSTSRVRVAGDGTLTFFAKGIRYRISIPELWRIYDFDETATPSKLPPFQRPQQFLGDNRHGSVGLQLRHADRYLSPYPPVLSTGSCKHVGLQDGSQQGEDT